MDAYELYLHENEIGPDDSDQMIEKKKQISDFEKVKQLLEIRLVEQNLFLKVKKKLS